MQRTNQRHEESEARDEAKPLKIGSDKQEVEDLIEEISHSGVADSEEDVERLGVPGPETGEDR